MGNLNGEYVSYVDLGSKDDGSSCWCSCTCGGKKMETPVRLRPAAGEEGQAMMQGLMENEERLQQQQQEEEEEEGEEEGDGQGEEQQQQQQQEEEAEQEQEVVSGEQGEGVEGQGVAPAPSIGVVQDEL